MQLEGRLDNRSMGEEGDARCYHSLSNSLPRWELCRLPWNWSSAPKRCRSMCEWHVRGGKSGEVLFEDAHRSLAVVSFIRISYQLGYWRPRWILDDFAHFFAPFIFSIYTGCMVSFNSAQPQLRLHKWGWNIKQKCKIATSSPWFQAFCLNACVIFPIRQVPVQPFEFHQLLQIIHLKRPLTCTVRHRNASLCKALMVAITICFLFVYCSGIIFPNFLPITVMIPMTTEDFCYSNCYTYTTTVCRWDDLLLVSFIHAVPLATNCFRYPAKTNILWGNIKQIVNECCTHKLLLWPFRCSVPLLLICRRNK